MSEMWEMSRRLGLVSEILNNVGIVQGGLLKERIQSRRVKIERDSSYKKSSGVLK